MYNPSNIKRLDEFPKDALTIPHHLYHCFGKYEYEVIAQRLLDISQQRGDWVSLPTEDFVPPFTNFEGASYRLQEMAGETLLLTKEEESFRLTKVAIEVLVGNYPSENGDN